MEVLNFYQKKEILLQSTPHLKVTKAGGWGTNCSFKNLSLIKEPLACFV